MSYDTKCYELAKEFLADEPQLDNAANRDDLAQSIQDAIENTIESMRPDNDPRNDSYAETDKPMSGR